MMGPREASTLISYLILCKFFLQTLILKISNLLKITSHSASSELERNFVCQCHLVI